MIKKLLIMITILTVICFGCAEVDSKCKTVHVALFISDLENPFFMSLKEHAELACQKKGYHLTIYDSNNSISTEKDHFDGLIHADMILLNPVDEIKSSEIVKKSNELGIPVITIDRHVEEGYVLSHIASDNYHGGLLAGELINKIYRKNDKVLLISGTKGSVASKMRIKGVEDYLETEQIPVKHVMRGNYKRAYTKSAYAELDERYDIVFAVNDEMALGVLDACVESDTHTAIIGFDGTEEAISSVIDGYMVGTVNQQPDLMAEHALDLTEQYHSGESIEEEVMVKLKMLTMMVR